jgi:hypothetical protein
MEAGALRVQPTTQARKAKKRDAAFEAQRARRRAEDSSHAKAKEREGKNWEAGNQKTEDSEG